MRILITLGPTQEPIDSVRYIGNRSSGRMGAAVVAEACSRGNEVVVIAGPITAPLDPRARIVAVRTAQQMYDAVLAHFPSSDVLIMAAAVADFRPRKTLTGKFERTNTMVLELEPTPDIIAAASKLRRPDQRTIAFSLEAGDGLDRAQKKMRYKGVDLMVYNPLATMNSPDIAATLLWPDGKAEPHPPMAKSAFAKILLDRSGELFAAE